MYIATTIHYIIYNIATYIIKRISSEKAFSYSNNFTCFIYCALHKAKQSVAS